MGMRTRKASYPAVLHLIAYGLAIALPLVLMMGALLFQSASYERDQSRQQILRVLGALKDSLDRDLDRHLTILQTLAVSSALQKRDWRVFYDEAKSALHGRSYVILVDAASGRQLVNTFVPHGEEPLFTGDPETVRRIAEMKKPVFSNLFTSLVVKKPILNISIPVFTEGELKYVLSLGLFPEELASLLEDQMLDPSWVSLIWDANNVVVASSRDHDAHVGQAVPSNLLATLGQPQVTETTDLDGVAVLYATSRSESAGWGIGVNVPVKLLARQSHITAWLAAASLLAIILAVGLGIVFARELTRPLTAASEAALALGLSEPITVTESRLSEANTFNDALQSAQSELARRRRAEDMMIGELQHRTNNLLAVVQAVAHNSLSGARSLEEAKASFEARLHALARIHRELTATNWSGVGLDNIVRLTLQPYAARINIDGATVELNAKDAQNMSLALHELATNAVKYGALSNSRGTVNISWTAEKEFLNFKWQETGGPPVLPPSRKGFGTSLLRATFSGIKLDYLPTGLTCEIKLPIGTSAMSSGGVGQGDKAAQA
jgi:two-component sensor histidine kinase